MIFGVDAELEFYAQLATTANTRSSCALRALASGMQTFETHDLRAITTGIGGEGEGEGIP